MRDLFNKNIKWMNENSHKCFVNKGGERFDIFYRATPSKEQGYPSLVAVTKNEEITIHSQLYPMKEAEKIAQSSAFDSDFVTVLGIGLGYVCHKIRDRYPDKKLVLIEPDTKLFYLALKYCELSFIDFDMLFVGYDDSGLASAYKDAFVSLSNKGNSYGDIYIQKSQERLYPYLYKRILNFLQRKSDFSLPERWKYKKFTTKKAKVIFIDSSYILSKECLSAIKNTGNLVHYIHIDAEKHDYDIFIKNLMNDIDKLKPDFIMSINHLGYDKEGKMMELFDEMEMPFVSWFVDSPNVILSTFDDKTSDFCNIFVWDDDYITQVKEKGYKHCDFLPLATDTNIFYPKKATQANHLSTEYPVSFVGSSMVNAVHKTMKSWLHRDDLLACFHKVVESFLSLKTRHVELALNSFDLKFDSIDQKDDFIAAVLWKGTQIYRKSGLDKLSGFMPVISGDPNWKNILPLEYELLPERWYYDDLCDFYNQTKINFNMTSLQMTNAVNQRVFDVSACRKFLLTDYRKQVSEFFSSKENMVWFDDVAEIPHLLNFYLKNDSLSEKIAARAYDIVLKHHTYNHRIKEMIEILRKRYK